jgi:hypothetical protein
MIWVSETTIKLGLFTPPLRIKGPLPPPVPPKVTVVVPVKPLPVKTAVAVPLVVPPLGETADITGSGAAVYVNLSAAPVAEVPLGVVTVTSTTAAACGGEATVMLVSEFTWNQDAATVPNFTVLAPVNPVPVIMTAVPPVVFPEVGAILVTEGRGAALNVN